MTYEELFETICDDDFFDSLTEEQLKKIQGEHKTFCQKFKENTKLNCELQKREKFRNCGKG